MEFEKPPCSRWRIWKGVEIEGTTDIGVPTLFVRYGNSFPYLDQFARIWFCKEFLGEASALDQISLAVAKGKKVCLEVTPEMMANLPSGLEKVQLYLKIEAKLKPGDHVCVGTAFKDEAWIIGNGATVEPGQYLADERIE